MNSDVRSDGENTGHLTDRVLFRREGTITAVLMNAVMAAVMSIGADLLHGTLSAKTALMILPGFAAGMVLSFRLPYRKLSAWLCRELHLREGGFWFRMISALPPALFQTVGIGIVMTALAVLPSSDGMAAFWRAYIGTVPVLFPVAFGVAVAAERPVAFLARKLARFGRRSG